MRAPISPGRRRLLQALASAPFALRAGSALASATASPRLLVLVFLYGGNDGFNTWVPFTDKLYYEVRPHLAVPRDAVLRITDRHGLHPSLAPLMAAWQGRELAIVQGIGIPDATQQHFRDIELAFTAADGDEFPREGWVTRAMARRPGAPAALADAVAFELLDIRESDPMGPFRGERLGVIQVHHAHELLAKRRLGDCVIDANRPGRERLAQGNAAIPALSLKTRFADEPFGQAVRAAVELAAFDRAMPVIHIALNGRDGDKHHSVDTHWDQLTYHGDALKRLAEGLAALRSGLKEIGRWDDTLVATYDEFGRSPIENDVRGTHHGHANTHFVLGGRVLGGLYGKAPPVERLHPIGGPAPVIDTRSLWTTVVEQWWNLDSGGLFSRRHKRLELLRA